MASIRRLLLFPLDMVLYPRERLPLHIHKEPYEQLTQHCEAEGGLFGVLYQDDGKFVHVGCTARITSIVEMRTDGRLYVLVETEQRFRMIRLYEYGKESYYTADVDYLEETITRAPRKSLERVFTQHMRLLEIAGRPVIPQIYEVQDLVSYTIGRNAALTLKEQQALLEIPTEKERINYLIAHLKTLLVRMQRNADIRRRVQSNGHSKEFPTPPE